MPQTCETKIFKNLLMNITNHRLDFCFVFFVLRIIFILNFRTTACLNQSYKVVTILIEFLIPELSGLIFLKSNSIG